MNSRMTFSATKSSGLFSMIALNTNAKPPCPAHPWIQYFLGPADGKISKNIKLKIL